MRKLLKWGVSALRVAACRISNGGRLKVAPGRPLYLGKGARIRVAEGASCEIGSGVYLSRGCLLQVNGGAPLGRVGRAPQRECAWSPKRGWGSARIPCSARMTAPTIATRIHCRRRAR